MDSFGFFKSSKKRGKICNEFNNFKEHNKKLNEDLSLSKYFNFEEPCESSSCDLTEEPFTIKAVYENDLNLIHIHNTIRAKFIYEKRKLNQINDEIIYLNKLILSDEITPLDVNCHKNRILTLNLLKDKILYGNIWSKYQNLCHDILLKYINVMSNSVKGIIVIGKSISENEEIVSKRIEYIENYLDIIRSLDILELDIVQKIDNTLLCEICKKPFSEIEMNSEGTYVCSCGYTTYSLYSSSEYKDPSKIPTVTINNTVTTFHRWLNYYEGTSGENVDHEMFKTFDFWCISNGYPTGEQIRTKNYNCGFTPCLSFLIRIMSETKYSKKYNNKNLIRHLYWGWKLPCLDQTIKKQAVERYIIIQRYYRDCKTRPSNLSMELLGYFILDSLGHSCLLCDFKIPSNPDTIDYTNNMLHIICMKAELPCKKIVV